jgi:hypothetical protein
MVKSLAGILALVLFFNVQVTNAQRVAPPSSGGGNNSATGSCVYEEDASEPNKGKGYCRNTNACAGICKKDCKTRTVNRQKVTTCECKCKSNGCKYTMTTKKPPVPAAGETPGAGTTPAPGGTPTPTPTPEVESVTCDGSCTDGSVDAARVGNGLANAFATAWGATGGSGASVSTQVKGVCQVIDRDPKSYERGETGCDCVSETVVNVR